MVGTRIVVTGMAGAGKSTFSRVLATKTGLPVICLDLHRWNPGWIRVPEGEFLEKQQALLAGERWPSSRIGFELLLRDVSGPFQ